MYIDLSLDEKYFVIKGNLSRLSEVASSITGAKIVEGSLRTKADMSVLTIINSHFKNVVVSSTVAHFVLSKTTQEEYPENFDHPRSNDLWGFQRQGVAKALATRNLLLADQVGMGKTIQALVAIECSTPPKDKVLVVCPSCVKPQWEEEILQWAKGQSFVTIRRRMAPAKRQAAWKQFIETDTRYFIIHYEALRLMPQLKQTKWYWIVLDEAHRIRNRKAQQTKAAKALSAQNKLLLTGTPVLNRPDELWSLLNFLDPKEFSSYWRFFEAYVAYTETPWGRQVTGTKNTVALRQHISPYVLRRRKMDYLSHLPPKLPVKTIRVDMPPEQARLYKQVKKETLFEIPSGILHIPNAIARLTRLRQLASTTISLNAKDVSGKLQTAAELISDIVSGEELVVVFCIFKATANALYRRLVSAGVVVCLYHGDTNSNGLKEFIEGKGQVLVTTIDACGEGVNLQKASVAIFLEKHYVPEKNYQAEGRLHRIGQLRPVHIINILSCNTVDESIEVALKTKQEVVGVITKIMELENSKNKP